MRKTEGQRRPEPGRPKEGEAETPFGLTPPPGPLALTSVYIVEAAAGD